MGSESPPAVGVNRRRHERAIYRDPVQVTFVGSPDQRIHALLAEDVSESGLALNAPEFFAIGARLFLDLEVMEVPAPIRLIGIVMWIRQDGYQDRYRIGVQFEEVSAEGRDQLRALVAARAS